MNVEAILLGAVVFLLLCAGLFVPLELWFSRGGPRPQLRAIALCASLFVLNTVLMELIGAPLLGALSQARTEVTTLRIAGVLVLSDLCGYFFHRAMHTKWLWRFHRVHHANVQLNWLEAWRQHPVDFVFHSVAVGLPGALLGASLSDIVLVVLLRKAWTSFLHADVTLRFGVLEWIISTPEFHRVHHSADPRDHDKNFAGSFPVWDVIFGTALISARLKPDSAREPQTSAEVEAGAEAEVEVEVEVVR